MMISVQKFTKENSSAWNEFLSDSKNGLFLFNRSYMGYHEDRFTDHSLVIIKNDKLLALFPANEKEDSIFSHAGLTFGGLITSHEVSAIETLEIFKAICLYFNKLGFKQLLYKAIPPIFHNYPACEDLYALFRLNSTLYRRDISSVIQLDHPICFTESKRRWVNKCIKAGITIREQQDFTGYWELLGIVLQKYGVKPVHSIEEISSLKALFPQNIRLFEAMNNNNELLAGVVIYDYGNTVHTQYLANSSEGRTISALDFINFKLITETFKERKFYSFGISTEKEGQMLNEGLIRQKESMGGRAIVNDFYKILIDENSLSLL